MVRISDIQDNKVPWQGVPFCNIAAQEIPNYILEPNDILFARTGGTVGKSFLVESVPVKAIYAGYLIRTRYSNELSPLYLKSFMESSLYWEQLRAGTIATAQPNCNGKTLGKMLLPIPPKDEQKRIVSKLTELTSLIENYRVVEFSLRKLNDSINESLKKSILQEAIQGRLVPQIKSEGTAEDLLEEIRAEKKRLVKEGKLKKSVIANESRIFRGDDNKYYEQIGKQIIEIEPLFNIPDSWSWVRLPQIAISELGKTLDKGKDSGEVTPYLCSINVYWTGIAMNTVKKARFSQSERCKYKLQSGDLLICEGGDVGRCSIWTSNIDMWYQNALHRVRPFTGINVYYLKSLIEHYKGIGIIDKICKGVTIKHFTQSALCSLLIPLPPYKEQCRIIQYLSLYDKI